MTNDVKKVPELRFPEFNEDWNERTLSDSIKILKSGLSRELSTTDIGLPVIRANNLQNYNLVLDDIKYWFKEDPKGAKIENYYLEKNDILVNFINSEAKMGTSCIIKSDFKRDTIYTTNILRYVTKEAYDSYFHYIYTQTYNYKKWIKIITKPAVNQASFTTVDFKKIPYYIPEFKEQQKIGDFFSKLDRQIELEEQKLFLLEEQKKGYMQKIFSQELRFKDENGNDYPEWEIKKLMQIAKVKTGSKNVQDNIQDGKYKFFDRSVEVKYLNTFDFDEAAIIYPGEGSKFLPRYFSGKYSLHQRAYSIYDININNNYLYYYLSLQNNHFLKYAVGSTVKSLRMSGFDKLKVMVPKNSEQEKIGSFFKNLDEFIEKQANKVELLKQRKQSFLQRLFV